MEHSTSVEALKTIEPKINVAHENILQVLRTNPEQTADEIAEWLDESRLFIRPRISELHKYGKIEKTGQRRKNGSGLSATVWRIAA